MGIDSTCLSCLRLNFIYLSIYFKYLYVSVYLLAGDLVSIFVLRIFYFACVYIYISSCFFKNLL